MSVDLHRNATGLPLPVLRQEILPTVADQVFDVLQQRIMALDLPPDTRISEVEVATQMGVSRQPVREAFKRLAKLGFLHIRPQSGTTVTKISEDSVVKSRFIRVALEMQTCRTACETMTPLGLATLAELIARQEEAVAANDRNRFHALDDRFHQEICILSGVGFAWDVISESKAHMDRVRMLSLDSSSQRLALNEHVMILDAIKAKDGDAAAAAITNHLSRIMALIQKLKAENHTWFTDRPR